MEIIGLIVAGAVIGALARFVMPGRQSMGMIMTIVLGVLGVLVGWYVAGALGVANTKGIDWIRWIISIAASAGFIAIYLAITGRKSLTR